MLRRERLRGIARAPCSLEPARARCHEWQFETRSFVSESRFGFIGDGRALGSTEKSSGLLPNDYLAPRYFLFSLAKIIGRNGLEVINVVEVNVIHEVDFRLNVARHGDVDDEQCAILS